MKKETKLTWFAGFWHILAAIIFLFGIFDENWFMLVGGFLMRFRHLEIVHWQGEKIE